jgi:hypothetical protein
VNQPDWKRPLVEAFDPADVDHSVAAILRCATQ